MDNIVTINNTKENVIDFDVSLQGITTTDIRVWFSITTDTVTLSFEAKKTKENSWEVIIPPLSFLPRTAHSCSVSLVADGYYFEPMTGTINVTGSADVYVKGVANTSLKSTVTDTPQSDKPTAKVTSTTNLADRPKTKQGEKTISQVASDMLSKKSNWKNEDTKKEEQKKDPKSGKFVEETRDISVAALLCSLPSKSVEKDQDSSELPAVNRNPITSLARPQVRGSKDDLVETLLAEFKESGSAQQVSRVVFRKKSS